MGLKSTSRVAIVTGGASGIGRASALCLARDGADVVIADRDETGGSDTVAQIEALGREALFLRADVAVDADCEHMVAATLERFGRLDIAFNNAGISGPSVRTTEYGFENFKRVIDVNLGGVFSCLTYELRAMRDAGGGVIVNTASVMGLTGTVGGSAYCAAKHGVIGLTKTAAVEYGRYGIRVNAICPGFIDTAMTGGPGAEFNEKTMEAGLRRAAFRRMGAAQEVGEAVAWLCSERASFVTGTIHTVDGGYSAS